jgi:hypothetical protein
MCYRLCFLLTLFVFAFFGNSVSETVLPALVQGYISPSYSNGTTGTRPSELSALGAGGGSCGGTYNYQWQSSTDNVNWTIISGATALTYGPGLAEISSRALKTKYAQNNFKYNSKELQNQEFSDGTGLEEYDYGARMYDPQIGKFMQQVNRVTSTGKQTSGISKLDNVKVNLAVDALKRTSGIIKN